MQQHATDPKTASPRIHARNYAWVLQLYFCCYTLDLAMRTSTFPPIRVEPEMRAQTEAVLREGESLTQFIEDAVRKEVEWRAAQAAFVARAQAALKEHEERGGPTLADVQARMQQRATKGAERIRAAVASRARAA